MTNILVVTIKEIKLINGCIVDNVTIAVRSVYMVDIIYETAVGP